MRHSLREALAELSDSLRLRHTRRWFIKHRRFYLLWAAHWIRDIIKKKKCTQVSMILIIEQSNNFKRNRQQSQATTGDVNMTMNHSGGGGGSSHQWQHGHKMCDSSAHLWASFITSTNIFQKHQQQSQQKSLGSAWVSFKERQFPPATCLHCGLG